MALLALCDACPDLARIEGADAERLPAGWAWRVAPVGRRVLYCPTCVKVIDAAGREFDRELKARGWKRRGQWGQA
jgi:hypothetical protein